MSRIYDNWDRLIGATLKREQFRELARAHSRDPSLSSISSNSSSTISLASPVHDQSLVNHRFDPEASSGPSTSFYRDCIVEGRPIPRSPDGILQLPVLIKELKNATISFRPIMPPSVKPISFKELKNATRDFRPDGIIGEGGFDCIFKGWINGHDLTAAKPGSGMPVAVKLNPDIFAGFNEFMITVNNLMQLRHPNLIRLIAYCHEGNDTLLVYEFMPRGSLDNHLFRRGYQCLSWATRIKVAVGAARGLSFLHDARNEVINRSFRASHILLDEEFNAKLSGFSLAKDGLPKDKTNMSTRVVGTYAYAAPEYVATGHFTEECDVYGFGVVLLELLSARRALDRSNGKTHLLVDWARPYLSNEMVNQVMDTKLDSQYSKEEAYIVANLALLCVSHHPRSRPRMAEVLAVLEQL